MQQRQTYTNASISPDINLRVTADEMHHINQKSLPFTDGSGYLGTLGVYHELHCIKRL